MWCARSVPLYPTSLSPDPVSVLSMPHIMTPALMHCAHPHTKIRFVLVFSCTRSLVLYVCSLSQVYIEARRPRRKAADSSRHHVESFYHCVRKSRGSRGQQGAQDASADAALARARVRAGLVLARLPLARQLIGRVGCRGHGPAFWGHRQGRPALVESRQLSATRAHAIAPSRLDACI